jgi:hypothetical protein
MPTEKLYDFEFGAECIRELKRRDLLGSSNSAHCVVLTYNLFTIAEEMEQRFQNERKINPLFETTAPEAWISAEILPFVKEVRAKVLMDDRLLYEGLQRYMRSVARPRPFPRPDDDEPLLTTIRPYIPAIKKLLVDVCDRCKSLHGILRLPANAYTVGEALAQRRPTTERQEIFLRGIRERWPNHRIAKELDDKGARPRSQDYRYYTEMLRLKPQNFYSLKSRIAKEYA